MDTPRVFARSVQCGVLISLLVLVSCSPKGASNDGGRVIGAIAADGNMSLTTRTFNQTFADGGEIESIFLDRLGDAVYLVRRGMTAKGEHRTEYIPLVARDSRVFLAHVVKWYVVCLSTECTECRPNQENTDCQCIDELPCRFGMEETLYETEVLQQ